METQEQTVADTVSDDPLQRARYKHLLTDGVYIKTYFVPAGAKMYTKKFPNKHISILAQGSLLITDGKTPAKLIAPAHINLLNETRYQILTIEDCVWYCVHPTQETDLAKLAEMF